MKKNTILESLNSKLFEAYILSTYYNGEIRYYAYSKLVEKPSLEGFYEFQEWHEIHKNDKVKEILTKNELILSAMKKEFTNKFKNWQKEITSAIPNEESLKHSGLFNSAGD